MRSLQQSDPSYHIPVPKTSLHPNKLANNLQSLETPPIEIYNKRIEKGKANSFTFNPNSNIKISERSSKSTSIICSIEHREMPNKK